MTRGSGRRDGIRAGIHDMLLICGTESVNQYWMRRIIHNWIYLNEIAEWQLKSLITVVANAPRVALLTETRNNQPSREVEELKKIYIYIYLYFTARVTLSYLVSWQTFRRRHNQCGLTPLLSCRSETSVWSRLVDSSLFPFDMFSLLPFCISMKLCGLFLNSRKRKVSTHTHTNTEKNFRYRNRKHKKKKKRILKRTRNETMLWQLEIWFFFLVQ